MLLRKRQIRNHVDQGHRLQLLMPRLLRPWLRLLRLLRLLRRLPLRPLQLRPIPPCRRLNRSPLGVNPEGPSIGREAFHTKRYDGGASPTPARLRSVSELRTGPKATTLPEAQSIPEGVNPPLRGQGVIKSLEEYQSGRARP